MKKRIFLFAALFLILVQLAYAGVTNPLPTELNLLKGESGRFKFQVQAVASDQDLVCVSSLAGDSLLLVEFDPDTITVPAGEVRDVYGTVEVPKELNYGTYEENFCITCKPAQGMTGAAVQITTCDLPIKVNVVAERTRDNMYVPPKPFPLTTVIIIIVVCILLLAMIGLGFYTWKKKNTPQKRTVLRKTTKKVKRKKD